MAGALLLFFLLTFDRWAGMSAITTDAARSGAMCWPFIPDCGRWYFLESLPDGYSQSTFYMAPMPPCSARYSRCGRNAGQ